MNNPQTTQASEVLKQLQGADIKPKFTEYSKANAVHWYLDGKISPDIINQAIEILKLDNPTVAELKTAIKEYINTLKKVA